MGQADNPQNTRAQATAGEPRPSSATARQPAPALDHGRAPLATAGEPDHAPRALRWAADPGFDPGKAAPGDRWRASTTPGDRKAADLALDHGRAPPGDRARASPPARTSPSDPGPRRRQGSCGDCEPRRSRRKPRRCGPGPRSAPTANPSVCASLLQLHCNFTATSVPVHWKFLDSGIINTGDSANCAAQCIGNSAPVELS
jgi:hypothetical protein